MDARKPVIGLVGGIGAGKTRAAQEFARLGCAVIDADAIGHELLRDDRVRAAVHRRWGDGVFRSDGAVDRGALARVVFGDSADLAALNDLLHPLIRVRMEELIDRAEGDRSVKAVVLDAAVLFEAGWDDLCSRRVFVSCPAEQRAQRVAATRGWDRATWAEREKAQISLDAKARKCDDHIDSSSSVSHLAEQVRRILTQVAHASGCS